MLKFRSRVSIIITACAVLFTGFLIYEFHSLPISRTIIMLSSSIPTAAFRLPNSTRNDGILYHMTEFPITSKMLSLPLKTAGFILTTDLI